MLTHAVDSVDEALRKALGWAGYGSLGPQVLLAIGGDFRKAKQALARIGLEDRVALFEATTGSLAETMRHMP